jgi:predicted  nucleic acid-binding Zn-ribbon protein
MGAVKRKTSVNTEVELLKKDITLINDVFRKLDTTIEKLEELTASMTKILSLHEQKLEYHERKDQDLDRLIELRRSELLNDIKELHSRVTTVNRELTTQIEHTETKITNEIKALKEHITQEHKQASNVVEQIQRWKWMILGGSAAVMWLISSVNFAALSKLFK